MSSRSLTPRLIAESAALVAIAMTLATCVGGEQVKPESPAGAVQRLRDTNVFSEQVKPESPVGAGGLVPTQEDKDIGRVGLRPGFTLGAYRVMAVDRFTVDKSQVEDEGDRRFAEKMTTQFQTLLVQRLRDTALFDRVEPMTDSEFRPGPPKALTLRGTITRLGRGSGAVRYFWGFGPYGALGRSRLQAEMYFADADSGEILMVTADRRVSRLAVGDEEALLVSFDDMATDLGKFLVRLSKATSPGK